MRFDVHKVRTYLVNELNEATNTVAEVQHDGSDIILAELFTGEQVIIQLIERLMPVNEIKDTLADNGAANRYTLFVLWGDMLLPEENQYYLPDDWMEVLYTLYNGKIYGYDSYGPYASVFPVYFNRAENGLEHFVTYGDAIRAANLHCEYIHLDTRYIKGFWRVADFSERSRQEAHTAGAGPQQKQQTHQHRRQAALNPQRNALAAYYAVLEISMDADVAAIRRAYYHLARRYHPDVSDSPDSTLRMQQINEAYKRIMEQFDD